MYLGDCFVHHKRSNSFTAANGVVSLISVMLGQLMRAGSKSELPQGQSPRKGLVTSVGEFKIGSAEKSRKIASVFSSRAGYEQNTMDSVMELDSNEPTTIQHQQPHQQPQRRRKPLPLHRCRFPDWNPSHIAALSITPPTFDTKLLRFGGSSQERGILAVGRANGDVELMCWGGHQGWVSWRVSSTLLLAI